MRTNNSLQYGAKEVADQLHEGLRLYLEAQYHIRDTGVIEERHLLLQEAGVIGQRPYVETTPSYKSGDAYETLEIPSPIGETLTELASWTPGIGVFPRPYMHQAEALQAFFEDDNDLVVSTGTGSGKTETFLLPILGQLLLEGATRPASFTMSGCRALLLYPMNALVSDQVARLRRLFGDERLRDLFIARYRRSPQFGMYTSRTPYPGSRTSDKDRKHLLPVLKYYLDLEYPDSGMNSEERRATAQLVQELRSKGRWPAKNLRGFFGTEGALWQKRLQTQPGDRELLTRFEIQNRCPDILVTNYSMLEYMLLRPIERTIFQQTRDWLAQDKRNTFILVLDEAHMYRGSGGAEIALLVRRLQARLGIPRERMRCILTSASLGSGLDAEQHMKVFAVGLTGHPRSNTMPFRLIQGQKETYQDTRTGTEHEVALLGTFDILALYQRMDNFSQVVQAVSDLAKKMGWPTLPSECSQGEMSKRDAALQEYLYHRLNTFAPLQRFIEETCGHARSFETLAHNLFPSVKQEQAEHATTSLLALGTYARNGERSLLSTRAHLFFRGLPSLYACTNPQCEHRRYLSGKQLLLGRLYTEPRTHCTCSLHARVYELYTHRDCGAAFLRVFGRGKQADFYWHEQGGNLQNVGEPLDACLLLVEQPHPDMIEQLEPIWLEMSTGRVSTDPPVDHERYRQFWRPVVKSDTGKAPSKKKRQPSSKSEQSDTTSESKALFTACPACTKRSVQKIMDLATKGEQPFANLVRDQFVLQPAVRPMSRQYPNAGRKVLLFSDGRQKAARLARDLPREVEFDSFRQVIVLAIHRLAALGYEATLNERLYLAFLSVCDEFHLYFFDRNNRSQEQLFDDIQRYQEKYDSDLQTALEENTWRDAPPQQYKLALLRQLVDPYYSLYAACAAVTQPSRTSLRHLKKQLSDLPNAFLDHQLGPIATIWIQALLERTAFDPSINQEARREIDQYFKPVSHDEAFKRIDRVLQEQCGFDETQLQRLRGQLYKILTRPDQIPASAYLQPSELALVLAIEDTWLQCVSCGLMQHQTGMQRCAYCNSTTLEQRPPDHPYMTSRKGFFREPLKQVLEGGQPLHISVEEHTAQLSYRDAGVVYATTEEYELRFQDVLLAENKPPVDILSCTTTMEVGIDIGSLTAVGLRNVPPQRENYQQRSGRAGRRGSALSVVLTYAQGGPHDNYYYERPEEIISGKPRDPKINVDNRRLARRHVHSFLIQTFFHEQLDILSKAEQEELARARTQLMSAFGLASDFFRDEGILSFSSFKTWLHKKLTSPTTHAVESLVWWLPDEICSPADSNEQDTVAEKFAFMVAASSNFIEQLEKLGMQYQQQQVIDADENGKQAKDAQNQTDDDQLNPSLLLNVLFDEGLLPSYAFPTDLCTFYVFEENGKQIRIKERPQQSKDKALSEYAPGRLLVINKETYRVGGIYDEWAANPAFPVQELFSIPPKKYVYCPWCTYVREESLKEDGEVCPVCTTKLMESEMLDPPGFSPERGKPLSEQDREQEMSYATSAQFPVPLEPDRFQWKLQAGQHLRYVHEQNRRLVIVNKGPEEKGFRLCEACGAAWPEAQSTPSSTNSHERPFLLEWRIMKQENLRYKCTGPLHSETVYLGHSFLTDLLLLRIELCSPLAYSPRFPWVQDALRTLAEALALAASLQLDIDPGELSAGYRFLPPNEEQSDALALVDIYLFDTASGGAGYAAEAGDVLPNILERAIRLLESCPGQCERSCTKCLRHYGNRYWHNHLDRHLGLQLLHYARNGQLPPVSPVAQQSLQLTPLQRFLELEGWHSEQHVNMHGIEVPLFVTPPKQLGKGQHRFSVGTYPALLDSDAHPFRHPLHELEERGLIHTILVNEYIVARDLPTAYKHILKKAVME